MVALPPIPWLPAAAIGRMGRRARAAAGLRVGPSLARTSPAAVRLPEPIVEHVPFAFSTGPQIFVHEGARQALERRFENAFHGTVRLAVTDNRRRMITYSKQRRTLRVRVHMMFLGAPDSVLEALVRYVIAGDADASRALNDFIDGNSHHIRAARSFSRPLRTRGVFHDLAAIFAAVNADYFGGALTDVLITWGRRTAPRRGGVRRSIRLGSYSAREHVVRIHPALDAGWVPRFFVTYVVFHELLHHLIPAEPGRGRVSLHPPEFVRREREFEHFERALRWERENLNRLLAS